MKETEKGKLPVFLPWEQRYVWRPPHLPNCLGLPAHPQIRKGYMQQGSCQCPGKREATTGCRQQGSPVQTVPNGPLLDMTWESAVGSWLPSSLKMICMVLDSLLKVPLLEHRGLKRWPAEVPSNPSQSNSEVHWVKSYQATRDDWHTLVCCVKPVSIYQV